MEQIAYKNITWINIEEVTRKDTEFLQETFAFHSLDLKDCLGAPQRPKVDIYDHYFFLVLHFPVLDKEKNVLRTSDLDIFLTKTHIITVQNRPIEYLRQLFLDLRDNKINGGDIYQQSTALLLYYILNKLYYASLSLIDDLHKVISQIEAHIFENKAHLAVKELAFARRNNLNMRGMLNPQRMVINTLAHIQKQWFNPEGEVTLYYDDILDYIEKNWILLETQKELVGGLYETNESLMSYKTSSIITVLTVFSVALLPLTLVTGFYGMNITLPYQNNPKAIWIIFFLVAAGIVGMIYYVLRKKEWV